jgi:hypothetical protein
VADEMDNQNYKDRWEGQSKEEPQIDILNDVIYVRHPVLGNYLITGQVDDIDLKGNIVRFKGQIDGIYPNGIKNKSLISKPINGGEIDLEELSR